MLLTLPMLMLLLRLVAMLKLLIGLMTFMLLNNQLLLMSGFKRQNDGLTGERH